MGISAGSVRNGPQISKLAMDEDRRRLHHQLTEAIREHEWEIPCMTTPPGPGAPDWTAEDPEGQRVAAKACRGCPVLDLCRQYGIAHPEPEGVYGALTRGQRSKLHGLMKATAAAAATDDDAAAAAAAAHEQTEQQQIGEQPWQQQHTRTGSAR